MSKHWYFVGQFIVVAVLSIVFFHFFGFSAIKKYVKKDVQTVVNSSPNTEGLPPPAITVCAMGDGDAGWKTKSPVGDFLTFCSSDDSFKDLEACVKHDTFGVDEIVNYTFVMRGIDNNQKLFVSNSDWTSSMTISLNGLCHTLVYKQSIDRKSWIVVSLIKKYEVILHDPTFYIQKSESLVIPYISLDKTGGYTYQIVTSKNTRMNRPGKFDCNTDIDYNFNQCVRDNLAAKIGCQFPWDGKGSMDSMHKCNTTKAIQEYGKMYEGLYLGSKQEVEELTGCQVPCHYQDYSIVGSPSSYDMGGEAYIALRFASTDITTKEEVLIFPFDSLVSEFGGALGLFLGFSFIGAFGSLTSLARALLAKGGNYAVTEETNTNNA
jgi:hypothetical protein